MSGNLAFDTALGMWSYIDKYGLTNDEVAFIESMIKPME